MRVTILVWLRFLREIERWSGPWRMSRNFSTEKWRDFPGWENGCTKAWRHERGCHICGDVNKFRVDGEVWITKDILFQAKGVIMGYKKDMATVLGAFLSSLCWWKREMSLAWSETHNSTVFRVYVSGYLCGKIVRDEILDHRGAGWDPLIEKGGTLHLFVKRKNIGKGERGFRKLSSVRCFIEINMIKKCPLGFAFKERDWMGLN